MSWTSVKCLTSAGQGYLDMVKTVENWQDTQTPVFWKIYSWGMLHVGALCFGVPCTEGWKGIVLCFPDLWGFICFYSLSERKQYFIYDFCKCGSLAYGITLWVDASSPQMPLKGICSEQGFSYIKGSWNISLSLKWSSLPGIFHSCIPPGFVGPPERWGARTQVLSVSRSSFVPCQSLFLT